MASPTFLELQNEVLSRDYGAANDRTNVKTWLNAANRQVHASHRWTWSEEIDSVVTVAGTETIAVPSNLLWVGRFRPANAITPQLTFVDPGALNPDDPMSKFNPTAAGLRGAPRYVTQFGPLFYLDPTPDAVYSYSLYFWRGATVMAADANEPEMPADDREVLVYGALSRAAERDRDLAMAQHWDGLFLRKLDEMRVKDSLRSQTPRYARMPRAYAGRYDRGR